MKWQGKEVLIVVLFWTCFLSGRSLPSAADFTSQSSIHHVRKIEKQAWEGLHRHEEFSRSLWDQFYQLFTQPHGK